MNSTDDNQEPYMGVMDRLLMTNSSATGLFNFSLNQAIVILEEHLHRDHVFDTTTSALIMTCYVLVISVGILSNLLVSCVIICNSKLRTTRNLFVFNLNMSDLALCIFCMPFTLIELVRRSWSLGSILCKLAPFVQGSTIFVASETVSAIAIDRYKTILSFSVQKTKHDSACHMVLYIMATWMASLLLSVPMCFSKTVISVGLPGLVIYEKCVEQWPSSHSKGIYTVFILATQFVIPTVVLLVTHFRIKAHLNYSIVQKNSNEQEVASERLKRELSRNRRATMVLMSISIVFAISWLPWNILNLVADFHPSIMSAQNLYLSFAGCHIIAMTSAISNPILYGWLNSNIRMELTRVTSAVAKVGTGILSYRGSNTENEPAQGDICASSKSLEEAGQANVECQV